MKRSEPWPEVTQEPIIHVDATPDGGYALRILQTYRENCNCRWEATPGNPLVDKMNADCEKRAMELDAAIAKLRAPDPDPLAERDKLREALRLILAAIPDGWEVPLLYGQIAAQCRAALGEKP